MRIRRNSLLYRWAFMGDSVGRVGRRSINICTLFWRCVLITPMLCIIIVLFLPVIPIFLLSDYIDRYRPQRGQDIRFITLTKEFIKAKKQRFCPVITVVDEG